MMRHMRRLLPHPLQASPDTLMARAGYVRHCVEAGRTCYHRRLNDPPFPRFHVLVAIRENGMEIDLHFDALDSITHKSNHDQPWAYEGGRVDEEMHRLLAILMGESVVGQTNHPNTARASSSALAPKSKRTLFEILFK